MTDSTPIRADVAANGGTEGTATATGRLVGPTPPPALDVLLSRYDAASSRRIEAKIAIEKLEAARTQYESAIQDEIDATTRLIEGLTLNRVTLKTILPSI